MTTMKVVGRFEIQDVIIAGVIETFTARDPAKGETVLLHLLPLGLTGSAEEHFRTFAPGCPGQVLECAVDPASQRSFVVTEYPRDRKALLLWIKQLTSLSSRPAPTPSAPAGAPAAPAATRMFDPAAIFGGAPPAGPPVSASESSAGGGATRMFDPSAVFGAAAAPAPEAAPDSGAAGGTRMFDPAAVFGAAPPAGPGEVQPPAAPAAEAQAPAPPPKSGPKEAARISDPFAMFTAAAAAQPPQASEPGAGTPKREPGEFTRRFERDAIRRAIEANKAMARATQPQPAQHAPAAETDSGKKGPFTGLLDAYGQRVDATSAAAVPTPTAAGPPESGRAGTPTRPPSAPPRPSVPSGGPTKAISTAELERMLPTSGATAAPAAKPKPGGSGAPSSAAPAKPPAAAAPKASPQHPPLQPAAGEEPGSAFSPKLILAVSVVLAILIVIFLLLRK